MKNDTVDIAQSREQVKHTQEIDVGKEAVAQAYEKLMEAKAHFQKAVEAAGIELKGEALEQVHKGEDSLEALRSQVSDSTRKNPLSALGIAFAVGFLVSKITSRN